MYQHGKRAQRQKNPKVMLYVAMVFGVTVIAVAIILRKDLDTSTKEKTAAPIITEVLGDESDTITIDEPLFSINLPPDWELVSRKNDHIANWYIWRSTRSDAPDRTLKLYIDLMPQSYKLVRMQPLYVNGNKFRLGNLSGECMYFAKDTDSSLGSGSNAPVEAKWEDVTFMCDPIEANQTIGTGTVEGGIGAKVGKHTFHFYYEDHNIRPDDRLFQSALRSFEAKEVD